LFDKLISNHIHR